MIASPQLRPPLWFFMLVLLSTCVEPVNIEVPPAQLQTVIEGTITDGPGPYTVKISQGISLDAEDMNPAPVTKAKVVLYDDEGNSETFNEIDSGVYQSGGHIRGQVGHAYHISVETADGKLFKSIPDIIYPVGEIEAIKYEYEKRIINQGQYETSADVFHIYVDSDAGPSNEVFVRWRFTGTYKVDTHPELHMTHTPPYRPYKDPWPCSGYIVVEFIPGGKLEKTDECSCCTCWAKNYEFSPQLSDEQLIGNNKFRNVKVGEVPINNATFHEKYMVEVEQMSLSRLAFDFFRLVRAQKKEAASLFQPPSGEIIGNIQAVNSDHPVIGLFWASAVSKKSIFIHREAVPYLLTPIGFSTLPCTEAYPNSSSTMPEGWE